MIVRLPLKMMKKKTSNLHLRYKETEDLKVSSLRSQSTNQTDKDLSQKNKRMRKSIYTNTEDKKGDITTEIMDIKRLILGFFKSFMLIHLIIQIKLFVFSITQLSKINPRE